jgi:uncharacterized SAM-binding protein YcdF (DUF218 family)
MLAFKTGIQRLKGLSHQTLARLFWLGCFVTLAFPLLRIPIVLSLAARQTPKPEAILILGGDPRREEKAVQLAHYYPNLDLWLSSGQEPAQVQQLLRAKGIAAHRLHLDYQASDTVTNFTTLVPKLKARDIQHVYLITSHFHMARAKAIAMFVLGSQGITYTPIPVTSDRSHESRVKTVRDILRALLWLYTGSTGPTPNFIKDDFL